MIALAVPGDFRQVARERMEHAKSRVDATLEPSTPGSASPSIEPELEGRRGRTTDVENILQTIRRLPVRDRLQVVELVVHEIANNASVIERAERADAEPSPLGLFADDPDEVDEMMKLVTENRRHWTLRGVGDEDEPGPR